jgi:HlyD family secretion protein
MDIRRKPPARPNRHLWIGALVAAAVACVGLMARGRGEPDLVIDRSALIIDSVTRGTLVRDVTAPGNLVPENVRIIAAITAGRVEQLPVRPGVMVTPETILVEMSNPDVELQQLESQGALTASEADVVSDRGATQAEELSQRSSLATLEAQLGEARRQLEVMEALSADGLAAKMELAAARDRARELASRESLERRRLDVLSRTSAGRTTLQRQQIARLRAISRFHQQRIESMRVRAGESGILQELPLELGQWVNPGMILARVAKPERLKVVIRVPESQARDVVVGQEVVIDTRNGATRGRITRIAPVSQGGAVEAEAFITGALPEGARASLGVDCTIEVQRIRDVLQIARPANVQPGSTVDLFRVDAGGKTATRVRVQLGTASMRVAQVISGLQSGDRVIVSEIAVPEGTTRVKLR